MMKNILKTLLKPDAYPEKPSKVELIQTHVSWIFLTDSHAYKIKKPVDFGFLNFSTIDRRRFYCNEELKYNRRLCPDIYETVVELHQNTDGAAFFGNGPVIDYAVKMKRLPAKFMLSHLVENNLVTFEEMRLVAKKIADFHLSTATSPLVSEFGTLDRILFNWKENFDQTEELDSNCLSQVDRNIIQNWVFDFTKNNTDLFQDRVNKGFIRECDGDLHLDNICINEGKVYIFDCIEFNERFRNCDTVSDIAFLLMDLDYHSRHDLSNEVLTSYKEFTGDLKLTELLTFYKIYRAFIRGKVESFRLNDHDLDVKEINRITLKSAMYFRLARGYIERQSFGLTLYIFCGLMGSGKSSLADQLGFELGISCYNSDVIRKSIFSNSPEATTFEDGIYSQDHNTITYNQLLKLAENELKKNSSVIIDASFIKLSDRIKFAELAKQHFARFVILNVSCSEQENRKRLNERALRGNSISDGREELLPFQINAYEPPSENEGEVIHVFTNKPVIKLINLIYNRLHSHA
jgi:uncharacterized protein